MSRTSGKAIFLETGLDLVGTGKPPGSSWKRRVRWQSGEDRLAQSRGFPGGQRGQAC